MKISENKRVFAISAAFLLAFGATMYYGYSRSSDFDATQAKLKSINDGYADLESSDCAPTDKNIKVLKEANAKVKAMNAELQKQMNAFAKYCSASVRDKNGKVISPVDLQNELRSSIAGMSKLAAEKGSRLSPAAADLGMPQYKNALATADDVPYRCFQLKAVTRVVSDVLESGAPVLDKVYCAALPTGQMEEEAFPLSFELAFEVSRGQLPAILNRIYEDKEYFLTVTGISILNKTTLQGIDEYRAEGEAAPAPTTGDDLSAAPSEPAPEAAPAEVRRIAVRKTGDPAETVRVHLNMQVRYFNLDAEEEDR